MLLMSAAAELLLLLVVDLTALASRDVSDFRHFSNKIDLLLTDFYLP
jgi:hypothetical protein